ncbi:hypothetical protein EMIT0P294_10918 [Pseudomonas sp. IT-P294]|jgi:hypothetical protein
MAIKPMKRLFDKSSPSLADRSHALRGNAAKDAPRPMPERCVGAIKTRCNKPDQSLLLT